MAPSRTVRSSYNLTYIQSTAHPPEYGRYYFAAFVFDPDGYRIEAVINEPVFTIAQIREGLRSKDFDTLFYWFCRARELGPETIEPAAEVVFDPDTTPLMRYWATELIAAFAAQKPERCRALLLGSLSDPSPWVRATALTGLVSFNDEMSLMCIRSHFEDHAEIPEAWFPPYTVSEAARATLAKIAGEHAPRLPE